MQRLYSMFPAGVPGAALLLLRVTAAAALLLFVSGQQGFEPLGLRLGACAVLCAFMCMGIFTPICSATAVAVESATMFGHWKTQTQSVWLWIPVFLCIAMLGPGAFSIDARLFGRQIIRRPPQGRP